MRVAHDEPHRWSIYMYSQGGPGVTCYVVWPEGGCLIFLGTWGVQGGPIPPAVLKWVQEREGYLWQVWSAFMVSSGQV